MYSWQNHPPIIPGTAGHLRPKPESTVAACVAPTATNWPYPANWGKAADATMPVPAGGWITCLGKDDSYYNDEFPFTSRLTGIVLDPSLDVRAAELAEWWRKERGLEVLVVEARKTVGAIVIGEVADESIAQDLMTAEGPVTLQKGDLIIVSPRRTDRIYRITPVNRKKRYAEEGRVFEGELPTEFC